MTALPAEDETEFTALFDADFPRVDLVGKGANGIPRFLIAKGDGNGLLEPDFVRSLIGKEAAPAADDREVVTMTGSPAAIAKLIHGAPVRQADPEGVTKAKNDAASRKHDAATGAAMPDGSYPIESKADLGKAIRAVGRGGADHDAIRRHVLARAKSLGAMSLIPDDWAADGSLKEKVSKDMEPELDDAPEEMDPAVVLAAPEEDQPGDPADPGSPAWEAIDAATARKWTSIAVRLRNALGVMAERELIEAASGDDGDADSAWDLQDAQCALDFAIDTLAGFAADEAGEAEIGGEAMAAIGKALAGFDPAPLDALEGFTAVAKAGRVLSASNEAAIRQAAASLNTVLSSLPSAPLAGDVTKEKEPAVTGETVTPEPAAPVAKADAPAGTAPETPVAKADDGDAKATMQAVFDANGKLVGIVDPAQITPVAGATGDAPGTDDAPADDAPPADGAAPAEPAPDPADLTPQPAADAGTPADGVAKGDPAGAADVPPAITADVLKSVAEEAARRALEAQSAAHREVVAKMAADSGALAEEVALLKGRLETVEATPAAPRVFTNGAVPPAGQLRGQDQGAAPVDVAKAAELKGTLYNGSAPEQARAFHELEAMAAARYAQIRAGARRSPAVTP